MLLGKRRHRLFARSRLHGCLGRLWLLRGLAGVERIGLALNLALGSHSVLDPLFHPALVLCRHINLLMQNGVALMHGSCRCPGESSASCLSLQRRSSSGAVCVNMASAAYGKVCRHTR